MLKLKQLVQGLLLALSEGDPALVFLSEDGNTTFACQSEFPATSNDFQKKFTLTESKARNQRPKYILFFQIDSKLTLPVLKCNHDVFNFLGENKLWLAVHAFSSHAISAVGFLTMKHATMTWRPDFQAALVKELNNHVDTIDQSLFVDDNQPAPQVPPLELISKLSTTITRDDNGKKTGTLQAHVLEIRCEKSKADTLRA